MKSCTRTILFLSLILSILSFGCDNKKAEQPENTEAQAKKTVENSGEAQPEAEPAAKDDEPAEQLKMVEVATAGTKFDPPVEVEQLPKGAWYCDMGTVHWAGMKNTEDGQCPECGMKLKQHDPDALAEQKKEAVEPHPHGHDQNDEHGHDDEHGHAH